jgi:hypothetical protein
VLLSLNVPSALNCCVPLTEIEAVAGVTVIDVSVGWEEEEGDDELHPTERTIAAVIAIKTERLINLSVSLES